MGAPIRFSDGVSADTDVYVYTSKSTHAHTQKHTHAHTHTHTHAHRQVEAHLIGALIEFSDDPLADT